MKKCLQCLHLLPQGFPVSTRTVYTCLQVSTWPGFA
nr:MAG TPA: hypothetical protein [Caudoviricetes sp.]